jgi:hypothetical protein
VATATIFTGAGAAVFLLKRIKSADITAIKEKESRAYLAVSFAGKDVVFMAIVFIVIIYVMTAKNQIYLFYKNSLKPKGCI